MLGHVQVSVFSSVNHISSSSRSDARSFGVTSHAMHHADSN
ncbi:unnamed protein product, partial [Linum tenue]